MTPGFTHVGTWYDYFTGESLEVSDLNASVAFAPGDYHLWTDVALETPENILGIAEAELDAAFEVVPNPGTQARIELHAPHLASSGLRILDLTGRCVRELTIPAGTERFELPTDLPAGPYLLRLVQDGSSSSRYWLNRD
jgi:hypothetical protein